MSAVQSQRLNQVGRLPFLNDTSFCVCTYLIHALLQYKQMQDGVIYLTNSLDSLPGPPPTQPALTDSTVDGLVSTTHPRFFKPSYMPQKWLKMPFVYICISSCAFILYIRAWMSVCTCEGLCACLHLYVCIVLNKSGRQLGLLRRECAG